MASNAWSIVPAPISARNALRRSSATHAAKVVGQIQYLYIPFLIARTFWLKAGWAQTADDVIFALLTAAIVVNTIHQTQILIGILATPAGKQGAN